METNKIKVDIGFANLTAELLDNDAIFPEICIYLEDKDTHVIFQDIVLVRPAINEKFVGDAVDCIVWANPDKESYTDKFVINKYIFDKEDI